jgi:hypothetical protein
MCNDEHGNWNGTNTNLHLPCDADIKNCNGTLQCGGSCLPGQGAQTPFKPGVSGKPGVQKYNEHPAPERPYERPEAPTYEKRPIEKFEPKSPQRPEIFQEEQRSRMPMEERER